MLKINTHIDDETRKSIKSAYGKDDYVTVSTVVNDIIDRYLHTEYFDSKLSVGIDDYEVCEFCEEKSKNSRMIDVDGTNLIEHNVCLNCGSGQPELE